MASEQAPVIDAVAGQNNETTNLEGIVIEAYEVRGECQSHAAHRSYRNPFFSKLSPFLLPFRFALPNEPHVCWLGRHEFGSRL